MPLSIFSQNSNYKIIKSGYSKCFDSVIYQINKQPYTCEPSTVSYFRGNIFIGNDKLFPEPYSSIFSFKFDNNIDCKTRQYSTNKYFKYVNKFEASTVTPDSSFFIFTGAFNYTWNKDTNNRKFNTAIFFKTTDAEIGGVLHIKNKKGKYSKEIKEELKKALKNKHFPKGPDYLKIEGLAAIPGNKLLFGVREFGKSYEDFNYTITIIQTKFKIKNNKVVLSDKFKKIYSFKPGPKYGDIALSSIEFNSYDSCLYVVTSLEKGTRTKDIGAYLWKISLDDLYKQKPLTPILDSNNQHIRFNHKIEGMTFVGPNKILLIADDDRIRGINEQNPFFERQFNEFFWYLIELY